MVEWLIAEIPANPALMIFSMLILAGFGFPVPEEVSVLFAGMAVEKGTLSFGAGFAVCYLGMILSDLIVYTMGRTCSWILIRTRWFSNDSVQQKIAGIRERLNQNYFRVVILARLLLYLRFLTFFTCGAAKLPVRIFVLADALAALISVSVIMSIGFFFSERSEDILGFLTRAALFSLVLFICAFVLVKRLQREKKPAY